ncbi:Peptidase inhibitor 16 [Taenia solium]|eukprot:TsM_000390600 transcript=TsM_000390600 gene=TsM_000390600
MWPLYTALFILEQLVWAESSQFGCARQRCDGLMQGAKNPQYLTVCQYKPGAKFTGKRPYLYGTSCSKCPEKYSCYHKQCVRHYEFDRTHPTLQLKMADEIPSAIVMLWELYCGWMLIKTNISPSSRQLIKFRGALLQ